MRTLQRSSQAWCLWVSAASRCSRRSCSFSLAWFYQPGSHSDFSAGFWEASLYLVVSAGLLAILLTASRQFSWLDVSVSAAAMLPVVLGMYVGQHMRDKIAPETFKKLVLIAVIAAGAELLLRHGFFS